MERTISAMIGKGSVNHNTRAFTAKNVDKNRSADNVEFCQEDIKQVSVSVLHYIVPVLHQTIYDK